MRRTHGTIAFSVLLAFLAGPAATAATWRQARVTPVKLSGAALPVDLVHPEGKTRWDLTSLELGSEESRPIEISGDTPDMMKMGSRSMIEPAVPGANGIDGALIEVETVGIGWVHLPSGPREVVLQRVLIQGGSEPDRLIHRWVEPSGGILAEVSGPATSSGSSRARIEAAFVAQPAALSAANLKIYVAQLETPVGFAVNYGRDKGPNASIASLTPQGYATMGALAAADVWDFSGNTTGLEIASYSVTPITTAETCEATRCGYNIPGLELSREDKGFTDADPNNNNKINTVTQFEQRATDAVVWLRAGAQNEGNSGGIGMGESRFCHITDGGVTRTPVPLWRFPNQDAQGWYMQPGDPNWGTPVFNCVQNLFNEVCGGGGLFSTLWAKNCTSFGGHSGTQWGEVVKGGVVITPSGHTFNALLVRNVADFCVYTSSACSFGLQGVRTVNYIWQVPWIGTVVRLQSATNAPDLTSYTTLAESDFKFGLFPPRSITVGTVGDTSVNLSWDPGLDTHRINGYRIYWDTDPGAVNAYAFNSLANPGQVAFNGTSATISGLTPGTTYYFTVTARSNNTNASTGAVTTYESLLYPTQVSGDPAFVYPTEVQARTTSPTCAATLQANNLDVTHAAGGDIQICWDASTDPCIAGYKVLGGTAADSDATFTLVADTPSTCFTGNPGQTFFLVTVKGTGGDGPWGHYGH